MSRRLLLLLSALALSIPSFVAPVAAIAEELPASIADREPAKSTGLHLEAFETGRFVVQFGKQAPLSSAEANENRSERGRAVVDTLKSAARSSQAAAIQLIETTPGASYESHWISNALVVSGSQDLIDRLATLRGVSEVRPELARPITAPVRTQPAADFASVDAPWGIEMVRAPEVWDQGITGGGVVVASLDSGVQFDHPALVDTYRGNLGGGTFDHNYNWFDASRTCPDTGVPCDDYGHGTHTMGTMVGGDGPGPFTPDVGMAPGAEWITVSCGPFFCSDSQLMEAGEWFLAPTDLNGENPDPARRPDIINNSWGGGPGDPFFIDFVQAWRAAGIVPVFASGNPGPFCGEGGSPGDYLEAFSVGATDSDDVIADFSGRGPSAFGKINPDVSAPGVFVLSSVPGNGYEYFDGTSMATPHVVGALALMMSANPDLRGDVDGVTSLLASAAVDKIDTSCGGDSDGDPNNVYGDGRIDAAAAVQLVASGGTITGTVTDVADGTPVGGAKVTATSATWNSQTFTGSDGGYRLFVPADAYVVMADAFGYEAAIATNVVVEKDLTTIQDLSLTALPRYVVSGVVRTAESKKPIAGAQVEAVGTPLEPVATDARGRYSLTVPAGSYTIRAANGGCMLAQTRDVDVFQNRTVNLLLPTKIDDVGHGCIPVDFDWIEAETQTGLYGDDHAGRLRIPFSFPFYEESYTTVYFTTNGYLNFVDEGGGFSSFFNTAIPAMEPPNAAVYALWQDLIIDDQAQVDYAFLEEEGQQLFVVEWENIAQLGSDNRLDMEVKLWEDGTVDILYGEGVDQLDGGSAATIGLENAAGTDAFQFSFREDIVEPNTAWRFELIPTGILTGTVTNANDGLPVAGATVAATPGDRSTVTDEDGTYRLVLVPGRYRVAASAPDYRPGRAAARITEGVETTLDFSLQAAAASIAPAEVSAGVDLGESTEVALTITNSGTAPLEWELKERQESVTGPPLDPPPTLNGEPIRRSAEWRQPEFIDDVEPTGTAGVLFDGPLDPIISDPDGDAAGAVDVTGISAGTDGVEASFRVDFTAGTPMGELGGYLFLDTDQDPGTGLPAEVLNGLPSQDVGMEYFVDLFGASYGEIYIVDTATFELTAILPAVIDGSSLSFDFPLEAVGGDDGAINVASVLGDYFGPTDWAPDVGHGELASFRDTSWMEATPSAGMVAPGGNQTVALRLGGPGVDPGSYMGSITLVSNDPRLPQIPVAVDLDVALPADFGTVTGLVLDERTSEALDALVTIDAEHNGAPYQATTMTDPNGGYRLFVPAGTWPISTTADNYVPAEGEVSVTAGQETTLDVFLSPMGPQIVISADEFLEFALPPGATDTKLLNIANTGTADVEFEIFERPVGEGVATAAPTREDGTPYLWSAGDRFEITEHLRSQVVTAGSTASTLETIIEDPPDDALASAEILAVRAGVESDVVTMAVDFAESTVLDEVFGLMLLDTDQNPSTGVPASEIGGLDSQDVGVEYFIDMYAPEGLAALVEYETATVVAFLDLRFEGQSMVVDLPLGYLPAEDGSIDVAAHFSDFVDQSDWAPDEGKGTINPYEDVGWVTVDPSSGSVSPADELDVTVTVDAGDLAPGVYQAELVVKSNDPLLPSFPVPITLTVIE